jgi:hypothetical protein
MSAEDAEQYSRGKRTERGLGGRTTYHTPYHQEHTNALAQNLGLGALSGERHKIDLPVAEKLADLGGMISLSREALYVFGGRGEILDLFYLDNGTQISIFYSVDVGVCAWRSIGQRDALGVRIRTGQVPGIKRGPSPPWGSALLG